MARPMGIEPTSPGVIPGVLSQLNYGAVRKGPSLAHTPRMWFCAGGNRKLCVRQISMGKWRDRTEALHAGNRTRSASLLRRRRYALLMVVDNRSTSAHRNWGDQTDLHRYQRRHRARCCYYTMITMKWSPWSDSHRRIRVYETRPVAAEAQRH